MIGRLKGILAVKNPPYLLIDVGGVGYEVQASAATLEKLPSIGQSIILYTQLHVREDAHQLYGFLQESERAAFRQLIKVSGVGPKLALTILSGIEVSFLIACIEKGDITPLVKLPGVGRKTAERLIVEMRDKVSAADIFGGQEMLVLSPFSHSGDSSKQEAISALMGLGYTSQEALRAVEKVKKDNMTSEDLIRYALQGLARVTG